MNSTFLVRRRLDWTMLLWIFTLILVLIFLFLLLFLPFLLGRWSILTHICLQIVAQYNYERKYFKQVQNNIEHQLAVIISAKSHIKDDDCSEVCDSRENSHEVNLDAEKSNMKSWDYIERCLIVFSLLIRRNDWCRTISVALAIAAHFL